MFTSPSLDIDEATFLLHCSHLVLPHAVTIPHFRSFLANERIHKVRKHHTFVNAYSVERKMPQMFFNSRTESSPENWASFGCERMCSHPRTVIRLCTKVIQDPWPHQNRGLVIGHLRFESDCDLQTKFQTHFQRALASL
jgi:hypothetical protein